MVLRLVIVAALAVSALAIDFEEAALNSKHSCEELSSQDCFTYHEAFDDKCKDYCDPIRRGQGGQSQTNANTQNTQGTTNAPDNGKKSKSKKGKKGHGGCFHGDDSVETNYGPMKMSDIVGRDDIKVLTRNADQRLEYSTVYSWLHANPKQSIEFIIFTTESGHKLPITGAHLIYESDCRGNSQTIFAKKVQVGKCLFVNDNGEIKESKIVDKAQETKVGVYAPITETGSIIVNDVLASCFTNYENEAVLKLVYSFAHQISRAVSSVLPTVVFESLFGSVGDIPKAFIAFMDLSKSFTK